MPKGIDQNVGQDGGNTQDYGAEKVHKRDESHVEEESAAKTPDKDEFHEVVDSRVDPTAALRRFEGEMDWG